MKNLRKGPSSFIGTVLGLSVLVLSASPAFAQNSKGSSNGQPFQDLQEAINAEEAARIAADIAESVVRAQQDIILQENIDQVAQDLDDLADSVSLTIEQLEADVADLQGRVGPIETELAQLRTDADANSAAITNLEIDLDTINDELAGKQDTLNVGCRRGSTLRVIRSDGSFICEADSVGRASTLTVYGRYVTARRTLSSRGAVTSSVTCPRSYQVTGGGQDTVVQRRYASQLNIASSSPSRRGEWRVTATNTESRNPYERFRAIAQCVRVL